MRAIAFIDGYNLYIAMRKTYGYAHCWMDYGVLCRRLLTENMNLTHVYYFSTRNTDNLDEHKDFVAAQCLGEPTGLFEPVWGKYVWRTDTCPQCRSPIEHREEKKTDVNLALRMYAMAAKDEYDVALLFTKDADQKPTIEFVHSVGKAVWLVLPPAEGEKPSDWGSLPDKTIRLTLDQMKLARLPGKVEGPDGREIDIDGYRKTSPERYRR